jgi:hypothetical protein
VANKLGNIIFPCCGMNWLRDGLSQAMDKKLATPGIAKYITKENINGYNRNPLGESITHKQFDLMNALSHQHD